MVLLSKKSEWHCYPPNGCFTWFESRLMAMLRKSERYCYLMAMVEILSKNMFCYDSVANPISRIPNGQDCPAMIEMYAMTCLMFNDIVQS